MRGSGQETTVTDIDATGATLVSRSCPVGDVSFRAFLAERGTPRVHWASPSGLELVGSGAAVRLEATGPDRFDQLRTNAATVFSDIDHDGARPTRPRMLGGLAFDAEHDPAPPWEGFPSAGFVLPAVQLVRGPDETHLTVTQYGPDVTPEGVNTALADVRDALVDLPMMRPSGGPPGVTATRWRPGKEEWTGQVERAVARIRDGTLRKVVLATALEVDLAAQVDVLDTLERLRRTYPDCYRFLVQPVPEAAFFGPPPERLVQRRDQQVRTEALAGSMPRGETPEEDAEFARSLREDAKLQEEQQLVTETIRDQLGEFGDVRVGEQRVRRLSNIQHLQTPIEAELTAPVHVLTLVEALHPTPAVGGYPPAAALETIRDTETFERGWYAAPVGWFDAAGDGEFAVGIRAGIAGGRTATLFAGNGIVADSNPAAEWDELQPKVRPILDELERRK